VSTFIAPLAGDYNYSGIVGVADYVVWRKGLAATQTQYEDNVWRSNFGQKSGGGSGAKARCLRRDRAALKVPATRQRVMPVNKPPFWNGCRISRNQRLAARVETVCIVERLRCSHAAHIKLRSPDAPTFGYN
jgi:hypothetical protein